MAIAAMLSRLSTPSLGTQERQLQLFMRDKDLSRCASYDFQLFCRFDLGIIVLIGSEGGGSRAMFGNRTHFW